MAVVEQGYRMVEVYGIRCLFASGILQQFQFRSVFLDSCHSQLVGSQQESRVNVDGVAQVFFALFFIGNFGEFLSTIALTLMLLISFSFSLLVWLSFTQWVFDRFITPKTQSANSNNDAYDKDGNLRLTGDDSATVLEYQRAIVAEGKSRILSTPVKPIQDDMEVYELPSVFTREDLRKLQESKDALKADAEAYAKEHEQDARYVEYSEKFDARERALKEQEEQSKKDKKKKK